MIYVAKTPRKKPKQSKLTAHGNKGEHRVDYKLSRVVAFDNDTKVISDVIFVDEYNMSHQIDHIVIRSNGVFVIETKNWVGFIIGREVGDWYQYIHKNERYNLPNPIIQNRTHCKVVDKIIGMRSNSLIVLTENNADKIDIPYVVNLCSLKRYLLTFDNGIKLEKDEIEYIYQTLMDASSDMTKEEHINNINRYK